MYILYIYIHIYYIYIYIFTAASQNVKPWSIPWTHRLIHTPDPYQNAGDPDRSIRLDHRGRSIPEFWRNPIYYIYTHTYDVHAIQSVFTHISGQCLHPFFLWLSMVHPGWLHAHHLAVWPFRTDQAAEGLREGLLELRLAAGKEQISWEYQGNRLAIAFRRFEAWRGASCPRHLQRLKLPVFCPRIGWKHVHSFSIVHWKNNGFNFQLYLAGGFKPVLFSIIYGIILPID